MRESEYIKVSNRVNISAALELLRDVNTSDKDDYGINPSQLSEVLEVLRAAESKLFDLIVVED